MENTRTQARVRVNTTAPYTVAVTAVSASRAHWSPACVPIGRQGQTDRHQSVDASGENLTNARWPGVACVCTSQQRRGSTFGFSSFSVRSFRLKSKRQLSDASETVSAFEYIFG